MSRSEDKTRVRLLESLMEAADGERRVEQVSRVVRTQTRVDVGSWLSKRPVWVCVLEEEILLVARGRRPYVERLPFRELKDSLYNHVTGELVLGPAKGVKVTCLRLPPLDAVQLLRCIGCGEVG